MVGKSIAIFNPLNEKHVIDYKECVRTNSVAKCSYSYILEKPHKDLLSMMKFKMENK